jgi:hypothetical protein
MTFEAEDLLELYSAPSQLEADRLVLMLGDDKIEAIARATTMTNFPTTGGYLILVRAGDAAQARKLIAEARRDAVIGEGGEFLQPDR